MSLLLSGSDGLSDVDGTAATPAIRGTDANTGIFFPAADTIAFSEGGVESARIDSSGNLGIGTTNPSRRLEITGSTDTNSFLQVNSSLTAAQSIFGVTSTNVGFLGTITNNDFTFRTNNTERARIDSSGNLSVGTTNVYSGAKISIAGDNSIATRPLTDGYNPGIWQNTGGAAVGSIYCSASATAYNTSSDYRLKENIAPMTGALEKIAALKPCTYTWKTDGSAGQGFIAHELQAVVPDCVTGAKDAVETVDDLDAEGRKIGTKEVPRYQGVDTSFLVATLVAALQEQQATISAMETRLAALEA